MLGYEVPLWVEFAIFCLCVYVLFRKDKKQGPDRPVH